MKKHELSKTAPEPSGQLPVRQKNEILSNDFDSLLYKEIPIWTPQG